MTAADTIYALSSGAGRAGIAVVRVSGSQAGQVLTALAGQLPEPRVATILKLKARSGEVLDQAMVLWFPAPRSVTGEDVAEFHLHGAPVIVSAVFAELATLGLRVAEAGEFTRRAFAHHKMDLLEAEGLADLLAAQGEAQRRLAMRQFMGEASAVYEGWRADIMQALALYEAAIDFSDEDDVAEKAVVSARPYLERLERELNAALAKSAQNAAVREGLKLVIAGAPNVGKSSLLNALVGRDAAIVSPIAGTTRDVVEVPMMFDGLPLTLADTAGLRERTDDAIERIGMARAQAEVNDADILLWVEAPDIKTEVGLDRRADIFVQNKADLRAIHIRNESAIAVSTVTGEGMNLLRDELRKMIHVKLSGLEDAVVVRQRHQEAVREAIANIEKCLNSQREIEIAAQDLRAASHALGRVTGHVDVEDLLGRIFAEFCIGK